jgi:Zn-finger nucleic acid-binding protein
MSTTDKPSRNEDEYFAKLEAERLERKKKEQAALSNDAERKSHYMRCPKCGGHLETIEFHRVQVDRCPDCAGLWLDNGEIDMLIQHEDKGLFSRALGDFMGSLKGKKGK